MPVIYISYSKKFLMMLSNYLVRMNRENHLV